MDSLIMTLQELYPSKTFVQAFIAAREAQILLREESIALFDLVYRDSGECPDCGRLRYPNFYAMYEGRARPGYCQCTCGCTFTPR